MCTTDCKRKDTCIMLQRMNLVMYTKCLQNTSIFFCHEIYFLKLKVLKVTECVSDEWSLFAILVLRKWKRSDLLHYSFVQWWLLQYISGEVICYTYSPSVEYLRSMIAPVWPRIRWKFSHSPYTFHKSKTSKLKIKNDKFTQKHIHGQRISFTEANNARLWQQS